MIEDGTSQLTAAPMHEGEFFGEAALIKGEPRSATVQAVEDMELYVLGKDDFQATLDASRSFREQLMKVFFQRP